MVKHDGGVRDNDVLDVRSDNKDDDEDDDDDDGDGDGDDNDYYRVCRNDMLKQLHECSILHSNVEQLGGIR